ncbi:MAG: methyltransferase domain-containing protein [Thermoprotei archaeon]
MFAGDTVLVPVKEVPEGYQAEECNPPLRKAGRRLSDLLPGVRSFVLIGDIALVSPKVEVDKQELYRAIKEIEPRVRAVYIRRKVSGELRINELEFVGGKPITTTTYKENGLLFYVDISKVYVNVTLASERAKLAREVCEERPRTVLDVFTGYGPIAVHLAKKGCYVVAGDLNLDGLFMLLRSLELNKLSSVDVLQYDAHYLPFRDKAFDVAISDNPTVGREFKPEVCRVAKKTVFYQLAKSVEEVSELLGKAKWSRVNEYSKDLFVFKGTIACNDVSN